MVDAKFVIFSGSAENVVWIEEVEGLGTARKRMDEVAAKTPGRYFVFHPPTQEIVATTDTSILDSSLNSAAAGWLGPSACEEQWSARLAWVPQIATGLDHGPGPLVTTVGVVLHRPLIGELAYQFRFQDRKMLSKEALRRAEAFFIDLQYSGEDFIALNCTKTATVYRLLGNPPNSHE